MVKLRFNIDPRTKISVLIAFNILALTFDQFQNLVVLTILSSIFYALSKPNLEKLKITLLLILPPIWGITLLQALFYQEWPRTILAVIVPPEVPILGWLTGGVYLYYQGFLYGLKQSLRLVSVMLLGLAIAWTTSENILLRALRSTLSNQKLSVGISIAVRFFHTIMSEAKTVYMVSTLSKLKTASLKSVTKLLVPLIAQVIRRSYTLTLALLSRGFNPDKKTKSSMVKLSIIDKVVISTSLTIASSLGMIKLLTVLFLLDILYIPVLRDVYWWVIYNL